MSMPVLYGAAYSVYVRIARLALEEKDVAYRLEEVDIFAAGGPPPDYAARHPFTRIPAFEHDGFTLYEAGAIARFVDEMFGHPTLQPAEPRRRARMNQIIGILDSYAYRAMVWAVYVERVAKAKKGETPDEAKIAAALPKVGTCLAALQDLMDEGPWLAGATVTLADLHAAPMVAYFRLAPEGEVLLAEHSAIARWWEAMAARPSMIETRFPAEE